jgi:hypothetical protein
MTTLVARLLGADLHLAATPDAPGLRAALTEAAEGSPFVLADVCASPSGTRARFVASHPELALGWRNVVDLQWRVAHRADIVHVERLDTAEAGLLLAGV